MPKHSEGITKRYKFDCEKKSHLKIAKEEDGTIDIRIVGEKNGSCSAVLLNTLADLINLSLKKKLSIDDIISICRGHICEHVRPGYFSCVDKMARDAKDIIDSEKAKEV